ncbi:hypothetical protein AAZX31_18G103900 [Glycine max]
MAPAPGPKGDDILILAANKTNRPGILAANKTKRSPKVDSMDRRSVNVVQTAFGLKSDVKAEKGKEVCPDS